MSSTIGKRVVVLVVDDQLQLLNSEDDRRATYETWLTQVSEFHNGKWCFDIKYCPTLRDVVAADIAPGEPVLAIVDMVLEGDSWTTTAVRQLDDKLINEGWPMILVSARFDSADAIPRANRLVEKHGTNSVFQFLTWASISRAAAGYEPNEVAFIVGAVLSRACNQDLRFKKSPDEAIEILHVTDPHFGKAYWDVGALISLRAARDIIGLPPADFLAITGDISDHGTPLQYNAALEYFEALADNHVVARTERGLSKDRVFVCPGNHDFSRTLALGANMSNTAPYSVTEVENAENAWIRSYAWVPYEQFDKRLTGQSGAWIVDPGYRINTRFISSGLIVLELNVERFSIEGYQAGISEEVLRKNVNSAVKAVQTARTNSEFVLVLAHRHESNVWHEMWKMIQSNLQGLATTGPVVFLCGHEHSADVWTGLKDKVLFIRGVPPNSGPTRPGMVLPMVHCISLLRANGAVTGVSVNQFKQDSSGWVADIEGARQYEYSSSKWRAV